MRSRRSTSSPASSSAHPVSWAIAGVAAHALALALLHAGLGIALGLALGLIALFYLALVPAALACYVIGAIAGRALRVLALLLAPFLAAWIAWSLVMHAGVSADLQAPPTPCIDKQGTHPC